MQYFLGAWECGFEYGMQFSVSSPYQADTPEDELWRDGWIEGALKVLGCSYYKTPEEKNFNQGVAFSDANAQWRQVLVERYFPGSA